MGVPIPASTLRERLPATVLVAIYRDHVVYGEALEPVGVINMDGAGDVASTLSAVFDGLKTAAKDTNEVLAQIKPEQIAAVIERIKQRDLPECAMAFVEFVELAERIEKDKGEPCFIDVSY